MAEQLLHNHGNRIHNELLPQASPQSVKGTQEYTEEGLSKSSELRDQVQFLTPILQLTTVSNSSPRRSVAFFRHPWTPYTNIIHRHSYRQNCHKHNFLIKVKCNIIIMTNTYNQSLLLIIINTISNYYYIQYYIVGYNIIILLDIILLYLIINIIPSE